jgi:anhydro-N-acetylmuramic acid kinase
MALIEAAGVGPESVAAIGSHGQTLRHRPRARPAFTLQWGDPSRIAERTGITTVADFRRRDVAAGGEGAPLAPAFHAAWLAQPDEPRAVLNLGGIANLTLLTPGRAVRGFDTGPANALLDAWCHARGAGAFDRDGRITASGTPDHKLLERLLQEPYFAQAVPKSTGREQFQLDWFRSRFDGPEPPLADGAATLAALTAATVAQALAREAPDTKRVIACGGGVRNPALMRALAEALAPVPLDTTDRYGVDPDFLEAMAFAWLARETLAGRPGNLPEVTGARGPRVLGAIYPA